MSTLSYWCQSWKKWKYGVRLVQFVISSVKAWDFFNKVPYEILALIIYKICSLGISLWIINLYGPQGCARYSNIRHVANKWSIQTRGLLKVTLIADSHFFSHLISVHKTHVGGFHVTCNNILELWVHARISCNLALEPSHTFDTITERFQWRTHGVVDLFFYQWLFSNVFVTLCFNNPF